MTSSLPGLRARTVAVLTAALASAFVLTGCFESSTTQCSSGVVCPAGSVCTADGMGCTTTGCGNMIVEEGETCDDGNQVDEDDCRRDCQTNICGDSKVDMQGPDVEECDEAGADTPTCDSDCTRPRCGDSHINQTFLATGAPRGEVCDDGDNDSGDGCSADCASNETCGDNYVNDDLPNGRPDTACMSATATGTNCKEVCDDGNNIAGDGCSPNCLSEESCRNGILDAAGGPSNPPELCDDGNTVDTDVCRNDCQSGFGCGNGRVDNDGPMNPGLDEQCDNGTPNDSVECDGDCSVPVCGDGRTNQTIVVGTGDPLEECDPATPGLDVAACDNDCTVPACGDGHVNRAFTPTGAMGPEACDDGNTTAGDGCSALCAIETCGNGVTEMINGEQCDDMNLVDDDACRNTCQFPRCGDGLKSMSEACDDGANTQMCNLDCTLPACGDGKINNGFTPTGATSPEQCDDGGTAAGDGCSASCQIESCGNGVTEMVNGEACDDMNAIDTDGCRNNCQLPRCGDGIASLSETCDTSGTSANSQTCDSNCSLPSCGDGFLNPNFTPTGAPNAEQCDDGGTTAGDGCSALCQIEPFALVVTKGGTGVGTVTSSPAGVNCGSDCNELYALGTSVTLTATPGTNSVFTGWAGGGCSGTAPCIVAMTVARNVVATFDLNTLTVTKTGNGVGTVTGTGINCDILGTDCTESYNAGTMVTLTATAGTNTTFMGWSGGGCSGTSPCTVAMNGATTVNANFVLTTIALTVTPAGNGTGTVTSTPAGISCGATCTFGFVANTVVTLTAAPAANNTFTGWAGGGCSGTGSCVVTLTTATAVTATFTLNQHQLAVVRAGNGSGSVTSSPGGINCGADCSENYNAGTVVTLTATNSLGSTFTGWSGGGCSGTGTCVVTVNAATAVTATFTLDTFQLTTSRTGAGNGTITSNPAGINCGSDCMENYNFGTLVTLTAVGSGNAGFIEWGGDCSGSGTCVVDMTTARNVTARFEPNQRILTLNKAGTGTGTVSSSPAGITCNAGCTSTTGSFNQGTVVTLTAAPSPDSDFVAWTGATGCTTSTTCMVTMSSATTVTATFVLKSVTVNVTNTGTGGGNLSSVPAAINCNSGSTGACSAVFDAGDVVGLVATPNANSALGTWSGACAGTVGTLCIITVTAPGPMTAGVTFVPATRLLTVTKGGGGTGTVAGTGINCDAGNTDCTESYNHGTMVTLTATAAGGSTFTGWTGDASSCGLTAMCVVTMDAAKTVTASFALQQFALTVNKTGSNGTGTVTSNPAGINCGTACSTQAANFTSGALVQLTASAAGGSSFTGWSGACTGTGACIVTMSAAQTVTAVFTLNTFAMNVTPAGAGTGTVTSSPAGINCGIDCTETYTSAQTVTLTAVADTGSIFTGWSGEGCSGTGPCILAMTEQRDVTATFALAFALNVTVTGVGTVSSSPAGISACAAASGDCTESYESGTMVTLTASANTTWTGCASSTMTTCNVTVDMVRNVTATFP